VTKTKKIIKGEAEVSMLLSCKAYRVDE
jgi:hypothetical protein